MKNKQSDLNNHLFAQLERLSDEDLAGTALALEIKRSSAMAGLAQEIVSNGSLALKAKVALREGTINDIPEILLEYKPDV